MPAPSFTIYSVQPGLYVEVVAKPPCSPKSTESVKLMTHKIFKSLKFVPWIHLGQPAIGLCMYTEVRNKDGLLN